MKGDESLLGNLDENLCNILFLLDFFLNFCQIEEIQWAMINFMIIMEKPFQQANMLNTLVHAFIFYYD